MATITTKTHTENITDRVVKIYYKWITREHHSLTITDITVTDEFVVLTLDTGAKWICKIIEKQGVKK